MWAVVELKSPFSFLRKTTPRSSIIVPVATGASEAVQSRYNVRMKLDPIEAKVVRLVLGRPGVTRGEIAAALPLSAATLAGVVKSLVKRQALVESSLAPSSGGRPAARLQVSEQFGYCYSHQYAEGKLSSCVTDATGSILHLVSRPVEDPASLFRGIDAAELELSVKVEDRPALVSVLVVPGEVDRYDTWGVARWVFGNEQLEVPKKGSRLRLVSAAGSLSAYEATRMCQEFDGPWASIDLSDCLSGLYLTRSHEGVSLDLPALGVEPSLAMKDALEERILSASADRGSSLRAYLETKPPLFALGCAEQEGDETACDLVDSLVSETAGLVRDAVRVLSPNRLILASLLVGEPLNCDDELRLRLHRRVGIDPANITLVSSSDVMQRRFCGGALSAMNQTLRDIV